MAYGEHVNSPMGWKETRGNFLPQQGWQQPKHVDWKSEVDFVDVKDIGLNKAPKLRSNQLAPIVGFFIAMNAIRFGVSSAVLERMHLNKFYS
jgi:hypothetical protein